jgi:hypothetical protein
MKGNEHKTRRLWSLTNSKEPDAFLRIADTAEPYYERFESVVTCTISTASKSLAYAVACDYGGDNCTACGASESQHG